MAHSCWWNGSVLNNAISGYVFGYKTELLHDVHERLSGIEAVRHNGRDLVMFRLLGMPPI
jgi:hypothetical protein